MVVPKDQVNAPAHRPNQRLEVAPYKMTQAAADFETPASHHNTNFVKRSLLGMTAANPQMSLKQAQLLQRPRG